MKLLILSHFHPLYGPQIVLTAPENIEGYDLKQIPSLMDLYDEGFFVHMFGNFKSANYIFEVQNNKARGSKELFLISVLIDIQSSINFNLSKELLEGFAKTIGLIPEVYNAFYSETDDYKGDEKKLKEVKSLFDTFYKSFPEENVIYERKDAKILVFGLSQAGKTTIINYQRNHSPKTSIPTTHIDISRILVNNISLFAFDTPGHVKFRDLWTPYLKNQDGLLFVLDVFDEENFPHAKQILHNITNMPQMEGLPLLLLLNKVDLIRPNVEVIKEKLELAKLQDRPIKVLLTSGLTGENINSAFNWMAKKLSERIFPTPKSQLGILFSRWDENIGVRIVAVHPSDVFDEPEVIAIKCFSISQYVFGGENIKRISVVLPFTHLKLKAAIYFDYIRDGSIRGGALLFSLVIFYRENIPRAIINQFNILIFEKLAILKEIYTNRAKVLKELKKLHSNLLKQLKNLPVQALRVAELRYQSLFKAARDAILIIDQKSGIIVDANTQAQQILQQPQEDIIGLHSSQLRLKNNDENLLIKTISYLNNNENPPFEIEIELSNGDYVPVESSASQIRLGGQNLIQCILRDITDRKKADFQLKQSERKYRHLFESSPFSITLINEKGIVIDCNSAIEELLGYQKHEIIGKKYKDLSIIHPKYIFMVIECLKNVVKGEIVNFFDVELFKKDKSTIWANLQSSKVKIEGETYIQIIARDISKQKEAEFIIKNRLKFERFISNISSRFLVIHDVDKVIEECLGDLGRFCDASRSSLFLINTSKTIMNNSHEWCVEGITPQKNHLQNIFLQDFPWLAQKLEEMDFIDIPNVPLIPDDLKPSKTFFQNQDIKSLLAYPIQMRGSLAGFISLSNNRNYVKWKDEDYALIGIFAEILVNALERIQAEEEIKKSELRYHEAYDRANFYKEMFVHDINNILSNIQLALSFYTKNPENSTEINKMMTIIQEQSLGGTRLISNIQKLSRIDELQILVKEIDIFAILNDAVTLTKNNFQEKIINISLTSTRENFFINGNDILIDVFENILYNAIKYNTSKRIEIEVKITEIQQNLKNYVRLEFIDNTAKDEDTGIDVAPNKDNRGMLLGLTLVDQVLNKLNGAVWVEGLNFVIIIPKA